MEMSFSKDVGEQGNGRKRQAGGAKQSRSKGTDPKNGGDRQDAGLLESNADPFSSPRTSSIITPALFTRVPASLPPIPATPTNTIQTGSGRKRKASPTRTIITLNKPSLPLSRRHRPADIRTPILPPFHTIMNVAGTSPTTPPRGQPGRPGPTRIALDKLTPTLPTPPPTLKRPPPLTVPRFESAEGLGREAPSSATGGHHRTIPSNPSTDNYNIVGQAAPIDFSRNVSLGASKSAGQPVALFENHTHAPGGNDILALGPPSLSIPGGRTQESASALSDARRVYAPDLPYNWSQIELDSSPSVPTAPAFPMPTKPFQGVHQTHLSTVDAAHMPPSGLAQPSVNAPSAIGRHDELIKWRSLICSLLNDGTIRTIHPTTTHTASPYIPSDIPLDDIHPDIRDLYTFPDPNFVNDIKELQNMVMERDEAICKLVRPGEALAKRVDALTAEARAHASILRRRDEMLEQTRQRQQEAEKALGRAHEEIGVLRAQLRIHGHRVGCEDCARQRGA